MKNATILPKWIPTSFGQQEAAEKALLSRYVQTPLKHTLVRLPKSGHYINTIDTQVDRTHHKHTLVLTHGYGAGLGLWFRNIDELAKKGIRVLALDWLGMGRSSRPKFTKREVAEEAENFFVDALEEWRATLHLNEFTLLGHSLGGYLSGCYAMKYPNHLKNVILASPVGLPAKPLVTRNIQDEETKEEEKLSFGLKLLYSLWNSNVTPQAIVRTVGPYGPQFLQNIIEKRFGQGLSPEEAKLVAEYVYHISAGQGSGEYAINALLELALHGVKRKGVYARLPLLPRLQEKLKVNMSILFGDYDWMYDPAVSEGLKKLSIPAHLRIVSNAGHHLYLDNPHDFHLQVLNAIQQPHHA